MSEITREDLITILKFGIHIAKIDADFHIQEKKILMRFSDAMNLTEEERTGILNQDASLGKGLGSLSTEEAEDLLIKTLCVVSFIDGKTSPDEIAFIEKVMGKFGRTVFLLPKEEWGSYEEEVFNALNDSL